MSISREYAEELERQHSNMKWGTSAKRFAAADISWLLESRSQYLKTVLDYGCGKGQMGEYLRQRFPNITVHEYDPGMPAPFNMTPTGQFDLVLTCDVLEHVEPRLIDDTIVRLQELTGKVLYNNIACTPTGHTFRTGPYVGEDIHLIVEEPRWWRAKFNQLRQPNIQEWEYRHVERMKRGDMRPRCTLIHERVG